MNKIILAVLIGVAISSLTYGVLNAPAINVQLAFLGFFTGKTLYWSDSVNLGVATDFPATRHKVKRVKKNPSLSELHSKKTISSKSDSKKVNNKNIGNK